MACSRGRSLRTHAGRCFTGPSSPPLGMTKNTRIQPGILLKSSGDRFYLLQDKEPDTGTSRPFSRASPQLMPDPKPTEQNVELCGQDVRKTQSGLPKVQGTPAMAQSFYGGERKGPEQ